MTSHIFHVTAGQAIAISFALLCIGIYIGSLFCRQLKNAPKDEDENDEDESS